MTEVVAVDGVEKFQVLSLKRPTTLLGRSEYSATVSDSGDGISTDNCGTRDRPTSDGEEGPAGGLWGLLNLMED